MWHYRKFCVFFSAGFGSPALGHFHSSLQMDPISLPTCHLRLLRTAHQLKDIQWLRAPTALCCLVWTGSLLGLKANQCQTLRLSPVSFNDLFTFGTAINQPAAWECDAGLGNQCLNFKLTRSVFEIVRSENPLSLVINTTFQCAFIKTPAATWIDQRGESQWHRQKIPSTFKPFESGYHLKKLISKRL